MSEENKKEEQELKDIEEQEVKSDDNRFLKETYLSKFVKTGLLALGSSILFKGKIKNKELVKASAVTLGTLALSEDNDYTKDAMVVASFYGIKNSAALAKYVLKSDPNAFAKAYKFAEKADKAINKFNLVNANIVTKGKEVFGQNFSEYLAKHSKENDGFVSNLRNMAFSIGYGIGKTSYSAISSLYSDGLSKSAENILNNNVYNAYRNNYQDLSLKELENLSSELVKNLGIDVDLNNIGNISDRIDGFIKVASSKINEMSGQEFGKEYANYKNQLEMLKKAKKFERINNSNFFTDIFGLYTKQENGKTVLRLDQILTDKAHIAEPLERLAKNFKNFYATEDPKLLENVSPEMKEALFIKYLRDNNFGELVDKYYKQEDLISFKEVEEMVSNSNINKLFKTSKKSSTSFMNFQDDNFLGIENIDILKNFGFTNVVKKGANNNFIDETALDGTITFIRGLGAIEKNNIAAFKIPIVEKMLSVWNPLKVIESDARIKNKIANEILGFAYNKHGYYLNGMHIAEELTETQVKGSKKAIVNLASYTSDGKRNAKVVFNQRLLNILTEDYSVNKMNHKREFTVKNIFRTTKENGIKNGFSMFTYSKLNPFSFRYNRRDGFKWIDESEAYFSDGSLFSTLFKKTDIDLNKLRAENRLNEENINQIVNKVISIGIEGASSDEKMKAQLQEELMKYLNFKLVKSQERINDFSDDGKELIDVIMQNFMNPQIGKTHKKRMNFVDFMIERSNFSNEKEIKEIKKFFALNSAAIDVQNNVSSKTVLKHEELFNFVKKRFANNKSVINDYLRENMTDTEAARKIYNLSVDYLSTVKNFKKDFNNVLHNNSTLYKNFVDDYLKKFNINEASNVFNPAYEVMKGHYLNKLLNRNGIDEDLMEALATGKIIDGNTPKPMRTFLGDVKATIKETMSKNKKFLHNESYEIFNNIEKETIEMSTNKILSSYGYLDEKIVKSKIRQQTNQIKNMDFQKLVDFYNDLKFIKNEEMSSSAIIRKTEFNFDSMKNILGNTKQFIYNLITGKNKDILDNDFNIHVKMAINGLQGALEYIGIERLTQKDLGTNGFEQIYNFMKKRYIPLYMIAGGVIAADTLSDALIPDDVPIIGNGISGVAVKGIAGARIGIQYALQGTGMLSLMRGIDNAVPGIFSNAIGDSLDILMSPEEMIDVYFRGKPIEVKANRWWFTAGRQSAQGEEFKQYRPHLWYIWQNKDAGVYSNKFEKLFRRDFAFTKYPWYLFDPYKEEREAYEKYGAVYPMTEQLFVEVPVIGQFLNATLGEIIKPTQYIGEERWRVGDDMMRNPNYDPNDPSSPKYIKFSRPNKFVKSAFEAVEDLKTFAGIEGYALTKITERLFGKTSPYQNEVGLSSIDQDIGLYARYDRLQLGDLFGTTEPIRRLVDDSNSLGMVMMNPLEQRLPDWMPDYFKKGNNPYTSWDFGNYILPSREFDRNKNNNIKNEELNQFRILSLTAPTSKNFKTLQNSLNKQLGEFNRDEQKHYYESLAFASNYGKRDYANSNQYADSIEEIQLKIDKKISPYEFISNGKRYKLDTVTDDFNKLTKRYGAREATRMMNKLNNTFAEGSVHSFKISKNAVFSVGIDEEGDFFKVDSKEISNKYNLDKSSYRRNIKLSSIIAKPFELMKDSPMPIPFEKIFGVKDVYNEWSAETVQAPFFRDWDTPISSFVAPFYTYSANSLTSAMALNGYADEIYYNGNGAFNLLGLLNKAGSAKLLYNKLTGTTSVSQDYKNETAVHDELEKIKFLAGDKSYYNMTGKEKLKQFSDMVNEQDAVFLKDLANVSNESKRKKILNSSNERMANVLKTIWNRHQMAIDNTIKYDDIQAQDFDKVIDIGAYYGNAEEARNRLKSRLNINLSKLDAKRQGVFNAYRGIEAEREADFIYHRMYRQYHERPSISSTIYGKGTINLNSRGEQY